MKLGESKIQLFVDNKLVYEGKINTFTRQFYQLMYVQMMNVVLGIVDITGTLRSVGTTSYTFRLNAGAGDTNQGIVVGNGTTPFSPTNYKLDSQIPNSTLNHSSQSVGWMDGALTLTRSFYNPTSSNVNVNEVGIYCQATTIPYYLCIERTVLSSSIVVEPAKTLTITYTIQM